MKKLLILAIVASFLFVSNMAGALSGGDETNNSAEQVQTDWQFYSSIDDVLVPDEILYAIQGEFPGFSATKADKLRRGGQEIYRLFVDRSDRTVGREGFYLLFDKNWRFIDKNDLPAQTEPTEPQPQAESVAPSEITAELPRQTAVEEAEDEPAEESSDEDGGETENAPEPNDPAPAE